MLTLGSLGFAAPWLLAAFLGLPILWWLLRLTPPSPKEIAFPAIRLLFGLKPKEETPDRSPWWLVLLRLLIAAFIILGLSHPVWNEGRNFARSGPLMLVIDNGWAAAPHWNETMAAAEALIDQAEREARNVLLLPTAPSLGTDKLPVPDQMAPAAAKAILAALQPLPWPARRDLAGSAAKQALHDTDANIAWLSDGLSQGNDIDSALAAILGELGDLAILAPLSARRFVLRPPRMNVDGLTVLAERDTVGAPETLTLRALDSSGHSLAITKGNFAADKNVAEIAIPLPLELRARVAALAIEDSPSAASVALLDEAGGQRPIGIISAISPQQDQPLLGELYYLDRALKPRNELRFGSAATLLKQSIGFLVLPDQSILTPEETKALSAWIDKGGMLIRFAGERLAAEPLAGEAPASTAKNDLLPVHLRQGDRVLGGALSWSEPAKLAPFPANSPFAGLSVPKDVQVRRQVLAEPDIELGKRTWARLEDGTPLVTGAIHGKGAIVLFHISGNAEWSDLPLSGLFVEMLDRLLLLSEGVSAQGEDKSAPLPPAQLLDGFGKLGPAPAGLQPLSPNALARQIVGPMSSPGLYGPAKARRALNLGAALKSPVPLSLAAAPLAQARVIDWKPWLLLAAFLLLLADFLVALVLRGLIGPTRALANAASFALIVIVLASASPVRAEDIVQPMTDDEIIAATQTTRLAFIRTGVPEIDATSHAGLTGLTTVLLERTSADMGAPVGLDLEVDVLEFYPLIYWPMSAGEKSLGNRALAKVNRYLAAGGLILFDTADQNISGLSGGIGPGTQRLQEITAGLDVPPLVPVPGDHVLARSFYLLKDFPGRWLGGALWVESAKGRINDGVASILVGSNDYAGAWAINDLGQPLFPVTPGGERQREMAYRFGINLVMYALTGNYKSDQVHVPSILERLGQ